ncbi:MAG: FmdE family protein [Pelotomaculaceae bacterium]|jgi:formylmethanofuran dehydrogenase subunit E|uniref:Formylmethanofuran dehydrogenase subunit E n=1 Tax=anaerobic digester metagenome TaxID=1263854 RepID=A0A485LUN3_9ZZZZ|nr:FmdE family protein [Bacillota bacterium]HHU87620.1 formylmethanofuran dehydrogenase [Peptococcaceae bacterium]
MPCKMNDWEKVLDFHGHSCPGVATGYRVAKIALEELQAIRAEDEELLAIVENDACGVDAVQVLTGCSIGKGNLIYRDYGKQVYTFACRNSGQAVRISVKGKVWQSPEYSELRKKVFGGEANDEEKEIFNRHQQDRTRSILEMPAEEFCRVQHVQIELPSKARIFNTHICAACGEPVMEPRTRVKEGKIVCIPCAEEYSRGW